MRPGRTIAACLVLAALAAWLLLPGQPIDVTIPPGMSASSAAALLKRKGVVRSRLLFRAASEFWGLDRKLMPGSYRLRRNMPLPSLFRALKSGSGGVKAAIPEGFSSWQIAERLEALGVCGAAEFLACVKANQLEGRLFPTTYYLEPSLGAAEAAARMTQEFKRRLLAEYMAGGAKANLTLQQALTLASIVEREAVHPEEKSMIAAVYLNRMRKRMRLEADPTVQYALGLWKKGLTSEDLRTESPYNTYIHYGLPPGPICSPGVDSFRAALHPAQTEAVYFVADNKGGHIFSTTHEEHLKAKRAFKRELRELKKQLRAKASLGR